MIIWTAIGAGALILGVVIGLVLPRLKLSSKKKKLTQQDLKESYDELVQDDVYHIFDKDFHKELTEKAKADFQAVIDENVVSLKESLTKTTEDIDHHLTEEITNKLQAAFGTYTGAIEAAQKSALDTIQVAVTRSSEQQAAFAQQLEQVVEAQRAQIMEYFRQNMAEIVSHYVLQAVGEQASIKEQLPMILREMEAQQEAMQRDMRL